MPGKRPGVLFCGGYTSDMTGTKALALEAFCRAQRRAFTRFDYSGHGASSGDFAEGTIGLWAEDALAMVDRATAGPLLVVGSSMGGWIMLLVALARPERIAGLIGVAAAPDFTADLVLPQATPSSAGRSPTRATGCSLRRTAGSLSGDPPVHRRGGRAPRAACALADRCPVHLLHGQRDPDVPWQTALRLADRLQSDDVTIELVKAGDHRLSSPPDLARITAAIERLATASSGS